MAWTVSYASLYLPWQPIVLGESEHQTLLLPQVPQQGQSHRTLGRDQAASHLRCRRRSLSRPRPRRPLDQTLVSGNGTEEKRHRYFDPRPNRQVTSIISNDRVSIILITHRSGWGFHAFMIQLPYYGERGANGKRPSGQNLVPVIRQAVA